MERKRKSFAYVSTKVYGGKPDNKTLGIRFEPKDKDLAIKFSRAILQAVEHGKGVDITVFKYKPLKDGTVRITVTAPR
ncbi:MAG: hypothetical protein P9X22_00445 [Candidatus Zapsychrus exili]|nr:hypothetical protein [Candidatus Zapsychrus exili]